MVVRFYGLVHWEDPMDEALGPANNSSTSAENAVTKDGILHYKAGTSYLGKEQWKTCFVVLRWAPGLWVGTGVGQGSSEKVLGPVCCPGAAWEMERTHLVTWQAKATSCGCPAAGMGLCGWRAGREQPGAEGRGCLRSCWSRADCSYHLSHLPKRQQRDLVPVPGPHGRHASALHQHGVSSQQGLGIWGPGAPRDVQGLFRGQSWSSPYRCPSALAPVRVAGDGLVSSRILHAKPPV